MTKQLNAWDVQEWRLVVQDLLSAMEAHDIAHFVEAGHPENYEACVAASDALQVAQIRARAMLEATAPDLGNTTEPPLSQGGIERLGHIQRLTNEASIGTGPDHCIEPEWWRKCNEIGHATSINDLSHRDLNLYAGAVEYFCSHCTRGEVCFPGEELAYLRGRVAFYERHTDTQANELVAVTLARDEAIAKRIELEGGLRHVQRLYEQALDQRDSALTELTDTRRFWQAPKGAHVQTLDALQAEKGVSQEHWNYFLMERSECGRLSVALKEIADMDLRFAQVKDMHDRAVAALARPEVRHEP